MKKRLIMATIVAAGSLGIGMGPVLAHGGAVTPRGGEQECRNLVLQEKGEGMNAIDGLTSASEAGGAVLPGHCH